MIDNPQSVSRDGVTVTKSLDRDRFKTPAVVFELQSTRDTPVGLAVTDKVPETVPLDDIGFHPDFGGANWSIDEHRVTFEYQLDAGENYTTVYGIRDVDDQELELVMEHEIDVEVVTPGEAPEGLEGIDDLLSGNENIVRDVLSGEREGITPDEAVVGDESVTVPESQTADTDATTEGMEASGDEPVPSEEGVSEAKATASSDAGKEVQETAEPADTGTGETTTETHEVTATEESERSKLEADMEEAAMSPANIAPDSIVSALATELESGDVDETDRNRLREALSVSTEPDEAPRIPGHVEARIEHLQKEVSNLAAYTDAMETFLDAYTSGESALDDIENDLGALNERIEKLESNFEEFNENIEDLSGELNTVTDDVAHVGDRLDMLEDELPTLTDRLESVEEATEDVTDLQEDVESLKVTIDDLETEFREDLRDLRSTLEDETIDPKRLADVESNTTSIENELDTIRDELSELREFREQLSSVLGPDEE